MRKLTVLVLLLSILFSFQNFTIKDLEISITPLPISKEEGQKFLQPYRIIYPQNMTNAQKIIFRGDYFNEPLEYLEVLNNNVEIWYIYEVFLLLPSPNGDGNWSPPCVTCVTIEPKDDILSKMYIDVNQKAPVANSH